MGTRVLYLSPKRENGIPESSTMVGKASDSKVTRIV
jgi:hypothetical protein